MKMKISGDEVEVKDKATGVINGEESEEDVFNGEERYDINSFFYSSERDFLIRSNGDEVKITDLSGKIIGIYFAALEFAPCRRFTKKLIEVYNEVSTKSDLEIVLAITRYTKEYNIYCSKMPWLAIPFTDWKILNKLSNLFIIDWERPLLVILDGNGKVLSKKGVQIIHEYGADPFMPERIKYLKEEEERLHREQTMRSILVSCSRNFLISNDGNQVLVSELEGKTVSLYFFSSSWTELTPELVEVYKNLKENGERFEVVLISIDEDEDIFRKSFESMPWLAVPFSDLIGRDKIVEYFEVRKFPSLLIIGPDGKTVNPDVSVLVEQFGIQAYPFTPEKLAEIEETQKARFEANALESILVTWDLDFVIRKDGTRVPVSELIGKYIILYGSLANFSMMFLPKLIKAYHEIKLKDDAFEVIFISFDKNQESFDNLFSKMPWLALPFGDKRKRSLFRTFKGSHNSLIVFGPNGQILIDDASDILMIHGADAYPFTEEHLKVVESKYEEIPTKEGWPTKLLNHPLHDCEEHQLVLTRSHSGLVTFECDACDEEGLGWSFSCEEHCYDLHPKCALED